MGNALQVVAEAGSFSVATYLVGSVSLPIATAAGCVFALVSRITEPFFKQRGSRENNFSVFFCNTMMAAALVNFLFGSNLTKVVSFNILICTALVLLIIRIASLAKEYLEAGWGLLSAILS